MFVYISYYEKTKQQQQKHRNVFVSKCLCSKRYKPMEMLPYYLVPWCVCLYPTMFLWLQWLCILCQYSKVKTCLKEVWFLTSFLKEICCCLPHCITQFFLTFLCLPFPCVVVMFKAAAMASLRLYQRAVIMESPM